MNSKTAFVCWIIVGVMSFLALAPALLHVFNVVEDADNTLISMTLNLGLVALLGTLIGLSIKFTILPSILKK